MARFEPYLMILGLGACVFLQLKYLNFSLLGAGSVRADANHARVSPGDPAFDIANAVLLGCTPVPPCVEQTPC